MTKADGADLDADEKVGVVNNFLHSLFKQVDVFLKEKQVTQATGTYAYRAYLETLLNYGPAAKKSQLTTSLFYKDTAGKIDVADPTIAVADNANEGLTEAYLKIRKVKVSPSISVAHELALKKGPAIYPIRRIECKSFIIPAGNPCLRKDNIFNGLVPKSFVFGLVASEAFNGAYKKNLYNFQHLHVSFVGITVNGEEMRFKPVQLSYDAANPRYIEAYNTLFSGLGKLNYDTGNNISRKEFPNGYAVYAFDLTPDMCGSSLHFNVVQRGNLATDIKFSRAPEAAVSLVCYGEFKNTIHIDAERNVIYDYSG